MAKTFLHFARWFLTNLLDTGSKGLSVAFRIGQVAGSRNTCILEGCFFQAAFTPAVQESQRKAGVKYSVEEPCFREDGEFTLTSATGLPGSRQRSTFPQCYLGYFNVSLGDRFRILLRLFLSANGVCKFKVLHTSLDA